MPWFLCPYKRDPEIPRARYCAFEDYHAQLRADGATWGTLEIDGNRALVKVTASNRLLNMIERDGVCTRLSDETVAQLRQRLGAALTSRRLVRCSGTSAMELQTATASIPDRELIDLDTRIR